MNDAIKMQVSAFVDGELPDNESELLLRRLSQDAELRQQVAEYYAVGRAMRGHHGVQGIHKLRERIAASIDDSSMQAGFEAVEPVRRRYVRPLAGVAIAATVALAALVGLQQITAGIDGPVSAEAIAGVESVTVPPVPVRPENELLQYRAIHSSSVDNIDARLMPLQLRENALLESDSDAEDEQPGPEPDVEFVKDSPTP